MPAASPTRTPAGRRALRVMQLGGTSVTGAERLRRVVRLVRAALAEDQGVYP